MIGGRLLAGLVGLPLGIAMGWWKRLRWIAFPIFQILRPVPPLAWIPLALLWLGIGNSARIFVVFIAAIVPWVMNSMQAVYSIDGLLVRAALTLGASDSQILTRVVCRTALPTLVAGARIALGNAWTTLVAAELLAATAGPGLHRASTRRARSRWASCWWRWRSSVRSGRLFADRHAPGDALGRTDAARAGSRGTSGATAP